MLGIVQSTRMKGTNMEFMAIGAFVAMFLAFVVLPKRFIDREDED